MNKECEHKYYNKGLLLLGREDKMTIIVRLEHSVPGFDGWKKVFHSDPIGREKPAVRLYRILRPVENPKCFYPIR